ncbi:PUB and ZnF_RBZ domain-containing protein tamozhennic isoform 1-T2 [Cochliomyia hominivorax]
MSDFVPRDILPELWDEILNRHWAYFFAEESMVKLEERKKLEDCLKEFLCIVQHDRKFFLPETARVLKNSIRDLENFNAQNAITAFESISQYANNLIAKPWRKEYRILKMYSGFYQHEIKSNLLDAEKLFEAMGYRRLADDILILDGPICPDQVTNVSRDAMTAYVELQIIKNIYNGLDSIGINCSWWDIYRYREKNTGSTSQAVNALANSVEEKRFRSRQKVLVGDNYGYIDVQPSSNYFGTKPQFCTPHCQCNIYQPPPPAVNRHRSLNQPINGSKCCVPEHHQQISKNAGNLVYSNMTYPSQQHYNNHQFSDAGGVPMSQMSHSRSLEHYSEPAHQNHHNILPHRHSFDHQQHNNIQQHHYYQHVNHQHPQNVYESPYESLAGGGSSISYAAVVANAGANGTTPTSSVVGAGVDASLNCNFNSNSLYSQPYNVSGNRIPLPLTISNQFSAYDNHPASANYMAVSQESTYAHISDQHLYSSVSKLPQNCGMNTTANPYDSNPSMNKDQRQHPYQTEHLINFDDPTPQQQFDPLNQHRSNYEPSVNHVMDKRYNMSYIMENPLPSTNPTNCQQHYLTKKLPVNDDMYVYAKPLPRENRKPLQNNINSRNYSYNSADRGDTTDLSYESANDDFNNFTGLENQSHHSHSPTQLTKNQDGVGSYETWNYVFKNLERSGYSKDLGEREDYLVESLDLDSLNINNDTSPSQNNSAEKRRANYAGNDYKTSQEQSRSETKQRTQIFENSKYSTKNSSKGEIMASASSSQKLKTSTVDNNASKKTKSTLKQQQQQQQQTNATSKSNFSNNVNQPNKPNNQTKTNDNKSTTTRTNKKTMNNNNMQEPLTNSSNGTTQNKKSGNTNNRNLSNTNTTPSTSTQIIVTGDNEWSCSFCTFLNPNTVRICEMCSHTKDFKMMDTTTSSTAGHNVTHNTTTCA